MSTARHDDAPLSVLDAAPQASQPWTPSLLGQRKMAPVPAARRGRRKLWELPTQHHCTLLGAAFEPRELRQLFRRGPYADWEKASDYALHSSAVHYAKQRCEVAERMHRLLEERFGAAVAHSRAAANARELVERWRAWALSDDAVAAYWAALTHPACDDRVDELLAQQMHMLQHTGFAERRGLARRLRDAHARVAELEAAQARAIRLCDVLRDKLTAAETRARIVGHEARLVTERLARQQPHAEARRLEALERENANLRRAVARLQHGHAIDRAPPEPTQPPPRPAAERGNPAAAPPVAAAPVKLAKRRVLCVGGKPRLVPHYRALIENAEGEFIHHDGGLEDHASRLPALLGAADAVVCLATDVSHCAYFAVKRYCKRFGKPCVLLDNSGVAAVNRALPRLAAAVRGGS
jgi:hypothetical protein